MLLTMNDEMLTTFLCLVESIINDRPISHNSDDPRDNEALSQTTYYFSELDLEPWGSLKEQICTGDSGGKCNGLRPYFGRDGYASMCQIFK